MIFDFYAYFNSIRPTELELAVFMSYLLFNAGMNLNCFAANHCNSDRSLWSIDDQSLNDRDKIASYQSLYHDIVVNELLKNRSADNKDHSLNTRTATAAQQVTKDDLVLWVRTCGLKLKRLSDEHVKILNEYKQSIQFPDLYAELYNL